MGAGLAFVFPPKLHSCQDSRLLCSSPVGLQEGRALPRAWVHAIHQARWVWCNAVYHLEQPAAHVRPDLLQS